MTKEVTIAAARHNDATAKRTAKRSIVRRGLTAAALAAGVLGIGGATGTPAEAASPTYQWYNADADAMWDMAVQYDGGRVVAVWVDTNNNGTVETFMGIAPDGYTMTALLYNGANETDGRWDALLWSDMQLYSNLRCSPAGNGFYQFYTWDPYLGKQWCERPSSLTGVITQPSFRGTGSTWLTLNDIYNAAYGIHLYG